MKKYNCFKCQDIIKTSIMVVNSKIKDMFLCENCYFTKKKIKDLCKNSILIKIK